MTLTTWEPETAGTADIVDGRDRWILAGYYAPNFNEDVLRELVRLAALQPNWDAQGAKPINAEFIGAARSLVAALPPNLIWAPAVVPMAKGNLQFEWHDGPRSLELEFESPETIHYLKWHPEAGVEEEGCYSVRDTIQTVDAIHWFMKGSSDA
jgi:hypothetical protein